jgi:hypothetical protein
VEEKFNENEMKEVIDERLQFSAVVEEAPAPPQPNLAMAIL